MSDDVGHRRTSGQEQPASVLIVDDEPQLRRALAVNLHARGYTVHQAETGEQALRLAADARPDVIVLDLGLPDLDGVDVVHGLRGWSDVPILILSVRETEGDKVAALDAGADDYITKPFGMAELLARLRAAVRRARPEHQQPAVTTPHFTIDLAAKRITSPQGHEVRLTPTEWGIVEILVRNHDRLVTQQHLLEAVWGPHYRAETNYLRVHLTHIRRKLEPDPPHPRYFHTEPGMGYRFTAT
jgi:two-component system, OmpR family, KDP operon response regulator KdpE